MQEELDVVQREIKNKKVAGLNEIHHEVRKTRQFVFLLLRYCNAVYDQNAIDRWKKGCILPFFKKGYIGIAQNYQGITLTSTSAKIYNVLWLNRIETEIEKILRKNQNDLYKNQSTTSQILIIRRDFGILAKSIEVTSLICWFLQGIWLHTQREDGSTTSSQRSTQGVTMVL